ncbi:MAG TPA: anhydro-N-acetylmuramic acid kinase [Gammaproteobacteria bacterium]|nr:anhydro-N-acetylmuramic acid kinase [Gammaproteobacteria bacterium]
MAEGVYLGLMSGTSMDGVDAALVRFAAARVELVAARTTPYEAALRDALGVLAAGGATRDPIDELGRLDRAVGEAFGAAAAALLAEAGVPAKEVQAIGSHGQTIRHRPDYGFSIQIGDAARIARASGITTVADFRRADLAAGGEGAPLAPIFHRAFFADPDETRGVLNLGGIANLTLLAPARPVVAFDVGPANILLDPLMRETTGEACDRDGRLAATGRVDEALLAALLADPWFARPPPKSSGPEYFNLAWLRRHAGSAALAPADLAATLTELSAAAVALALDAQDVRPARIFGCGGGVHNPELMRRLAARLPATVLSTTAELGVDPDYVEAICFAWLAGETLAGRPGNLPEVTGARRAVVLGATFHP